MSNAITEIFTAYQEYLNAEQDVREEIRVVVRDLEQTARELLTVLQAIHYENGADKIAAICSSADTYFEAIRGHYKLLAQIVPHTQYYRYHDHWRCVTQRVAFLASLYTYLNTEKIITRVQVAEILGVKATKDEGAFHIDLEDFLGGLLTLANELARFAVNSVTMGDFSRPTRISKFIGDLHSGFKVLNLKNDMLRKRFDGLKYDVKKVEEVVYDLSIRGLKPKETE